MIRPIKLTDAEEICDIYNPYVNESIITFEEVPVPAEEMARRIRDITTSLPWLVYVENEVVRGFTYAGRWIDVGYWQILLENPAPQDPG